MPKIDYRGSYTNLWMKMVSRLLKSSEHWGRSRESEVKHWTSVNLYGKQDRGNFVDGDLVEGGLQIAVYWNAWGQPIVVTGRGIDFANTPFAACGE